MSSPSQASFSQQHVILASPNRSPGPSTLILIRQQHNHNPPRHTTHHKATQTGQTSPSRSHHTASQPTRPKASHFPRHLDRHPAHLTLFHALPGSQLQLIAAALAELCAAQGPVRLATGAAFRMRRGVGINVADGRDGDGDEDGEGGGSRAVRRLHGELQRRWWGLLSAQDRRPWRPHWTVQNKAAHEGAVDVAMDDVRTGFRGAEGLATGCALWRYEKGGRWAFERCFDFGGDNKRAP
ncbi:putative rna ligase cyclic nucleotide phosphodiesterase [Diaporthe ampelina]|uniref:Putative rna ligase cyclic nucleotide phosphodiesterase n=1 Tax=Diaporthe ampelina TaxID=1214573 RepID=A0A0G2HFK1_9PEZI|nr:putative rna ligase cyclic nucleotide phosphodiesterase [Diaporthe ampelina]